MLSPFHVSRYEQAEKLDAFASLDFDAVDRHIGHRASLAQIDPLSFGGAHLQSG